MKKLSIVLFALFLSVCLLGCNDQEKVMDYITYPTGLEINGEVLFWDEVADAKGYIVYANGVEVEDTKELSYDFSDIPQDQIIFKVQAKAPRGYEDSGLSASVGYLEDDEDELEDMIELGEEYYMGVEDDFFEELIRKGMTADELEDLYIAGEWIFNSHHDDTLSNLLEELQDYLDDVENLEAFISAIVVYLMPGMFDQSIFDLEMSLGNLNDYLDDNPDDEQAVWIQEMIDNFESTIEIYEDFNDEIEDNPDAIVLAVTNGIQYLFDLANMTTTSITDILDQIVTTEKPGDLTASEMAFMFDEMVMVLEETMPSQENLMIIFTVFEAANNIIADARDYDESVEGLNSKLAVQARYSIQSFINLLETFDEAFFERFLEYAELENVYEGQYEALALLIEYLDTYYDENQGLFDNIDEVFTIEEKEILYKQFDMTIFSNLNYNYGYFGLNSFIGTLNYDELAFIDIYNMGLAFRSTIGVLLDDISDNPEIIDQILTVSYFNYYEQNNFYLGEFYDGYDQCSWNGNYQTVILIDYIMDLMVDVNSEIDEDGFLSIYNVLIEYIESTFKSNYTYRYGIDLEDLFDVLDVFGDESSVDLQGLYNDIFTHLQDEDTFGEIATVLEGFLDSTEEDLSSLVIVGMLFLSVDDYLTDNRVESIDDLVDDLLAKISESDLADDYNLTDSFMSDLDDAITEVLNTLTEASDSYGNADFSNLSEADKDAISDYLLDLSEPFEAIYSLIEDLEQ